MEDAYLKMSLSLNLEIVEQTTKNAWQRAGQFVKRHSAAFSWWRSWWGSGSLPEASMAPGQAYGVRTGVEGGRTVSWLLLLFSHQQWE